MRAPRTPGEVYAYMTIGAICGAAIGWVLPDLIGWAGLVIFKLGGS